VALRHQLWLVLPLSRTDGDRSEKPVNSGMYVIERNVRFGSIAVIQTNSSSMAALGRLADTQPGGMSAFTNTGRSDGSEWPDLNVSFRPRAELSAAL
jgi:hypothetical protein